MLLRISSATLAILLSITAAADSWTWKDNIQTWRFTHGFRVDVITDKISRDKAKQYMKIVKGSNVVTTLNGVGFQTLAASPKENLFVGLSNGGMPGTAAVVFDAEGRLLLYVTHGTAQFEYCDESIMGVIRVWHGSEAKDIQFENEDGVGGISLLDCRGNRVKLLEIVSEAFARRQKQYEEWKVRQESGKK
jgi:hypothetical protein